MLGFRSFGNKVTSLESRLCGQCSLGSLASSWQPFDFPGIPARMVQLQKVYMLLLEWLGGGEGRTIAQAPHPKSLASSIKRYEVVRKTKACGIDESLPKRRDKTVKEGTKG